MASASAPAGVADAAGNRRGQAVVSSDLQIQMFLGACQRHAPWVKGAGGVSIGAKWETIAKEVRESPEFHTQMFDADNARATFTRLEKAFKRQLLERHQNKNEERLSGVQQLMKQTLDMRNSAVSDEAARKEGERTNQATISHKRGLTAKNLQNMAVTTHQRRAAGTVAARGGAWDAGLQGQARLHIEHFR